MKKRDESKINDETKINDKTKIVAGSKNTDEIKKTDEILRLEHRTIKKATAENKENVMYIYDSMDHFRKPKPTSSGATEINGSGGQHVFAWSHREHELYPTRRVKPRTTQARTIGPPTMNLKWPTAPPNAKRVKITTNDNGGEVKIKTENKNPRNSNGNGKKENSENGKNGDNGPNEKNDKSTKE